MSGQNNDEQKNSNAIDLSELSGLQFATAWTPSNSTPSGSPRDFKGGKRDSRFEKRFDSKRRNDFQKDGERKPRKFDNNRKPRSEGDEGKPPFKKFDKKFDRKFDRNKRPPFNPTMEVLFYPDDAPFNKLADIMKASKRTYQLFDIAQLVLEKPDRFIVLAKNLPDAENNVKPLFCAQPMNLPFEDEALAKNAAVEYYLDELFSREQIDAEPPKGSFQVVNKCSKTGDILGAPNWHKYNEFIREYHSSKFPNMPFDAFLASIESVRDEEAISQWLEQMKKRDVYKLKNTPEGENEIFETREAAINYINHKMGAELVKKYDQVRMRGSFLNKLPFGRIRKNIEETCRRQKRFPIVTANNLRGRLRRSGFVVYKRGSNGFAFVSSVRRKFLYEGDTLSELPQKIFDFITRNPAITAAQLPYKFLGLEAPEAPKAKSLAEENKQGGAQQLENQTIKSEEIDEETKAKLNSAWSELLWLISEGYVVEYADSTLQANPYLPRPKDKSATSQDDAEQQASSLGAADEPLIQAKSPVKDSAENTVDETAKNTVDEATEDAIENTETESPVKDTVEEETIAQEARDEKEEIAQEKQDEESKQ